MGAAFTRNAVSYHHTGEQVDDDAEIYCIALDFEVDNVTSLYLVRMLHTVHERYIAQTVHVVLTEFLSVYDEAHHQWY